MFARLCKHSISRFWWLNDNSGFRRRVLPRDATTRRLQQVSETASLGKLFNSDDRRLSITEDSSSYFDVTSTESFDAEDLFAGVYLRNFIDQLSECFLYQWHTLRLNLYFHGEPWEIVFSRLDKNGNVKFIYIQVRFVFSMRKMQSYRLLGVLVHSFVRKPLSAIRISEWVDRVRN